MDVALLILGRRGEILSHMFPLESLLKCKLIPLLYEFVNFRVMTQVSCELVVPKDNRPSDGIMFFNVELSPMASPGFEVGRYIYLSRLHPRINLTPPSQLKMSIIIVFFLQAFRTAGEVEQTTGEMSEEL